MDGVLADFVRHILTAKELHEFEREKSPVYDVAKRLKITQQEMWERTLAPEWWSSLPVLHGGPDVLFQTIWSSLDWFDGDYTLAVVTEPHAGNIGRCCEGKAAWLDGEVTDAVPLIFIAGASRSLLARPNALLIDDNEANVAAFTRAGGKAILFPALTNRLHKFEPHALDFLAEAIQNMQDNSYQNESCS